MQRPDGPLHIKYRPQNFTEFHGNESIIETLQVVLDRKQDQVRSFLITGPTGCGKTTLGRLIGKELNCSKKDFYEYDIADARKIEDIRGIKRHSRFAPLSGKVKIYMMDEVHRATSDAQSALLKLLEDTPRHIRFILCTTNPEKLLPTILRRCEEFEVGTLKRSEIVNLLKWVCKEEDVGDVGQDLLTKISKGAGGSPGKALKLLDQIIDLDEDKALEALDRAVVNETSIIEICRLLIEKRSPEEKWKVMVKLLQGLKDNEPEQVRYAILEYLRKVLLSKGDLVLVEMMGCFMDSFIYSGRAGLDYSCFLACRV